MAGRIELALAEAYRDHGEVPAGVYSTAEVADAHSVSERKAREFIRRAIADGKMKPVRIERWHSTGS